MAKSVTLALLIFLKLWFDGEGGGMGKKDSLTFILILKRGKAYDLWKFTWNTGVTSE